MSYNLKNFPILSLIKEKKLQLGLVYVVQNLFNIELFVGKNLNPVGKTLSF